jgi:hypothetical protein
MMGSQLTRAQNKYQLDIDVVERMIHEQGLAVLLASNPRNPTGQVIQCAPRFHSYWCRPLMCALGATNSAGSSSSAARARRPSSSTRYVSPLRSLSAPALMASPVLLVVHVPRPRGGLRPVRLVRAVHRGRRHGAAPRPRARPGAPPLTRAQDSTVIVDGLTKNWRLPGWRVCWVIGPKNLISALSQSGSYLDGGANHPCVPRRDRARAAPR